MSTQNTPATQTVDSDDRSPYGCRRSSLRRSGLLAGALAMLVSASSASAEFTLVDFTVDEAHVNPNEPHEVFFPDFTNFDLIIFGEFDADKCYKVVIHRDGGSDCGTTNSSGSANAHEIGPDYIRVTIRPVPPNDMKRGTDWEIEVSERRAGCNGTPRSAIHPIFLKIGGCNDTCLLEGTALDATPSAVQCEGTVQLCASVTNSSTNLRYDWDLNGDAVFDDLTTLTPENCVEVVVTETVQVTVQITDQGTFAPDCVETAAALITVNSPCGDDCDGNGLPDECDLDCSAQSGQCNVPGCGEGSDCNTNGVPDECDIADGTSEDCDADGTPDECEPDCNGNQTADDCDIIGGTSDDCDTNGVPDDCQNDTDSDGTIDACDDCPDDPDKTEPGECGCGSPDVDSDSDGILDCHDDCVGDNTLIGQACDNETDPDDCASGVYDCSTGTLTCTDNSAIDDQDGDAIPDCQDNCIGDDSLIGLECDSILDADDCASGVFDCTSGTLVCTDTAEPDDADSDGVDDCDDTCEGDDSLIGEPCDSDSDPDNCAGGVYDCSTGALICNDDAETDDADGDGVPDCEDSCVGDESLVGQPCDSDVDTDACESGVYDCTSGTLTCTDDDAFDDADSDGIADCLDECEGDDSLVGQACDSEIDADICESGVYDCSSGTLTCTDDDALDDSDGDGVADCDDSCVGDQSLVGQPCDSDVDADACESGVYDCTSGTLSCTDDDAADDADSDGIADCLDGCEGDDSLIGQPCDSDVDADTCASGVYDCTSGTLTCTDDDAEDDADSDGVADCDDTCVGDESLVGQACDSDVDADACENGVYDCTSGTLTCTDDAGFDDADSDGIADCDDTCVGDDSLIGQMCDSDVDTDSCASGAWDCSTGTLACSDDDALDDADSDGVPDCEDACTGDESLVGQPCDSDVDADTCETGLYDCSSGTLECTDDEALDDSDGDQVPDCVDGCVGDEALIGEPCDSGADPDDCASGIYDCNTGTLNCSDDADVDDSDSDGVPDCRDNCVGDDALIGEPCDSDVDTDACETGVYDCSTGTLTCNDDDALDDIDGDQVPDCEDNCIGDQSLVGQSCDSSIDPDDCPSGVYDCTSGSLTCTDDDGVDDSDSDGVDDCDDTCVGDDSLIGQSCDGDADADDCASGTYDCSSGTLTCTDDAALDDADGDGIPDCDDTCIGDDSLIGQPCDSAVDVDTCESGVYDCTSGSIVCTDDDALDDADGDQVADCDDQCPGTELGQPVGVTGCSCAQAVEGGGGVIDVDSDGVPDACDNCPNTFNDDQADTDGDLIGDACDGCDGDDSLIGTPCDSGVDADGCPAGVYDCSTGTLTCTDDDALDDADGDLVPDCEDSCVGDESLVGQPCDGDDADACESGVYDCSSGTLACTDDSAFDDADSDGIADCEDACVGDDGLIGQSCDTNADPDDCENGVYECSTGTLNCTDDAATEDADSDGLPDCDDTCVGDDSLIGTACDNETDTDLCETGVYDCSTGTLVCNDDDAFDDVDGDNIPDCDDPCIGDDSLIGQPCDGLNDADSCPDGVIDCTSGALACNDDDTTADSDSDGIVDCEDDCVGDGSLEGLACDSDVDADACESGVYDCTSGTLICSDDDAFDDSDSDGVADCDDACVGDESLVGHPCDSDADADSCESGTYDCTSGTLTCSDDAVFDDADSDGIADCLDACDGDDSLVGQACDSDVDADACESGVYDCSTGTLTCTDDDAFDDSDSDGVADCEDACDGDESLVGQACDSDVDADVCESGTYDCTSGTLTCTDDEAFDDSDSDGVADCDDTCVGDESLVGQSCDSNIDLDACESGVYDCTSGTLTCSDDDAFDDSDGDGVADCVDVCIGDDTLIDQPCDSDVDSDGCESGTYDCTSGTLTCTDDDAFDDSDGDGVSDCTDPCVGDQTLIGHSCDSDVDTDTCATGLYECTDGTLICTDGDSLDDFDSDGVIDCDDLCVGDDALLGEPCDSAADADDCASGTYACILGIVLCNDDEADDDADGDGIGDCNDICVGDDSLLGQACDSSTDVDACESGVYECINDSVTCTDDDAKDDADSDGVADCEDECPGTAPGAPVGATGCSCEQLALETGNGVAGDADSDGIPDECDNCPDVPNEDQSNGDPDQSGDACDTCVGDDSLIGEPCDGADADSCATGTYDCTSGTLSCDDDAALDDADSDGIPDCDDICVGDNGLLGDPCDSDVDADDCASGTYACIDGAVSCTDDDAEDDADSDGVDDCQDQCPGDDALLGQSCDGSDADDCESGVYACVNDSVSCTDDESFDDADSDGVADCDDACPGTAEGAPVGVTGCSCEQLQFSTNGDLEGDADSDGVPDACDNCPNTPNPDQDNADGDQAGDACDPCLGDDNLIGEPCDGGSDVDRCDAFVLDCTSGTLVCTDDDAKDDADSDGVPDCQDGCEGDQSVVGQPCDSDEDADTCASGIFDCVDGTVACTDDAALDDADNDGVSDCEDACVGDDSLIGQSCDNEADTDTCESGTYDCTSGTLICTDDALLDDADGDNVPDCEDTCEGDDTLIGEPCDSVIDADTCASGTYDCTTGTLTCSDDALTDDADSDGITDCEDTCVGDDSLIGQECDSGADADTCATGTFDCSSGTLTCSDDAALDDADSDGVPDCKDPCTGDQTLIGHRCDSDVDSDACETGLYECVSGTLICTDGDALDDLDSDGVVDCEDLCVGDDSLLGEPCDSTADADNCASGTYACVFAVVLCTDDAAEDDTDGDGVSDCDDICVGDDSLIGATCDSGVDADNCATGTYDCTSGTLVCTDDEALDDSDSDGVADCDDGCVGDNALIGEACDSGADADDCATGVYDCPSGTLTCTDDAELDDADGDNVPDCDDTCVGDQTLVGLTCDSDVDPDDCASGVYDCSSGSLECTDDDAKDDADSDGVADCDDACPGTPAGVPVGAMGCSCEQLNLDAGDGVAGDADSDGVPDECDNCPNTPNPDQGNGDPDQPGDACDTCVGDDSLIGEPCDGDDADGCATGTYDCTSGTLTCDDDAALDDSDGDAVADCDDTCVGDDALIGQACDSGVDTDGCASGEYDCSSGTLICTDGDAEDDSDGDGIADCDDTCVGDDALIGEPCDGTDADSCATGTYDCTGGTLSCDDDAALDDADSDGIPDCDDTCVGDNGLLGDPCDSDVDSDSCASGTYACIDGAVSCTDDDAEDDADSDGVEDCQDQCPGDDALLGQSCDGSDADDCESGVYACVNDSVSCTDDESFDDADSDGVADCDDACPDTVEGASVGVTGCACEQLQFSPMGDLEGDADGDGVPDACDNCPNTPNPDQNNADGDQAGDACDPCLGDDNLIGEPCDGGSDEDACATGVFDCTSGTLTCTDDELLDDSDTDGVPDCEDTCEGDQSLVGQPCDSDADADNCASGVYDCSSGTLTCTDDAALDDSDSDGIADCQDGCEGDDSLIGTSCDSDVDADSCASGVFDCSTGILACTDDGALDDVDGDAIPDCEDECVGDDSLVGEPCDGIVDTDDCASGVYECSLGALTCTDDSDEDDSDGDGVDDCDDLCTGDDTLLGRECDSADVDSCKSGLYECINDVVTCTDDAERDDVDGDLVPDCEDDCPDTAPGASVGATGCSCDQILLPRGEEAADSDSDGIPDICDNCPNTSNPNQVNSDADPAGDACDACEGDDALIGQACDNVEDPDECASGVYDCSSGILTCTDGPEPDDADSDGTPDCLDDCPDDPAKTEPGACGCGVPDVDEDGDDVLDCNELLLDCAPVELVFVMDTSGSMGDEASAVCSSMDSILNDLAAMGVNISADLLGITQTPGYGFSCLSGHVAGMLGTSVPGDPDCCPGLDSNEDWATATSIVADRYPWAPDSIRIVVPIGDEGPNNGDPCNDPGDDRAAIYNAIVTANANDVFVAPITGTGSSMCVTRLAHDLAIGTGGTTFATTDPSADLATAIQAIVVDICVNRDEIVRDEPPTNDACPGDPSKVAPGACGCGEPDSDANRNGIVDCLEAQDVNSPDAVCGSCGAVGMVVYPMAMIGYAAMMFSRRRTRRIRLTR